MRPPKIGRRSQPRRQGGNNQRRRSDQRITGCAVDDSKKELAPFVPVHQIV